MQTTIRPCFANAGLNLPPFLPPFLNKLRHPFPNRH